MATRNKSIELMLKHEIAKGCDCKKLDCKGPSYKGQMLIISSDQRKRILTNNMKLLICENQLEKIEKFNRDSARVAKIHHLIGAKTEGDLISVEAEFKPTAERVSLLKGCTDLIEICLGLKSDDDPIKVIVKLGPKEYWVKKILLGYWYVQSDGSILELYSTQWWDCWLIKSEFDDYKAQKYFYKAMIRMHDDEVKRIKNIPKDEDKPKRTRSCSPSSRASKQVACVSSSRNKSLKPKGRVGRPRKSDKTNENALSSESSFSPSIPKVWDDDDGAEDDTINVIIKEEKENIEQKVSTTQIDDGQGEVEQTVPTPEVDVVDNALKSPNSISDNATNSALNPVQVDREKIVPTAVVKPSVHQSTTFSINEVDIGSCGTLTKPPEAENNSQVINVDPLNNASDNENNENEEIDIDIDEYQNVLDVLPIPSGLINRYNTQQDQLLSSPRISKTNLNPTSASMASMAQVHAFGTNTQRAPLPANATPPKNNIFADKITEVNYMHYPVGVSTQMFEPPTSDGPQYPVPNMVVTNMASPRTMSESVVAEPLKQLDRMTKSQQQASEQNKFARYDQFVGNMDQENSLAFRLFDGKQVSNPANHSEFNTNYGVRNHAQNWQTENTTHNGANCTNSNYQQMNGNMNNYNLFTKSMASMGNSSFKLPHDRGIFNQTNHAVLSQTANTPNGANDQNVNSNQAYNWGPTTTSTASNFTGNNLQMNFPMAAPMPTTMNSNRSMDAPNSFKNKEDLVNVSPTYNIFMSGSNNTQITGPNSFNGHSSMQNQSERPHQQQNKQPTWNNFTHNFAPIHNPQQNQNLSKPIQSGLGMSSYSNCCTNNEMSSGSAFSPQTLTADNPMEYNSFTNSMASMNPQYSNGTIHNNGMQVRVNCAYYGCPKSCDDPEPYDPYSRTVANPKRNLAHEQPMILNNHYRSTYQNNAIGSSPQNSLYGSTKQTNAPQMQYNTQPSTQSRQFAASCHQLEKSHQPKRRKIQNRQNGTNSIPVQASQFPRATGTQEMFPRTGRQSVLSNQQFQTNIFNTAAYGNSYGNSSGISQNPYQVDFSNFNYSQMNQSNFMSP